MANAHPGPRAGQRLARDRRRRREQGYTPKSNRRYLLHLAPLTLALIGAIAGGKQAGQALTPMAVLLPPDVRYSAELVSANPPGASVEAPSGSASVPSDQATAPAEEPLPEDPDEQELFAFTTHEVADGETLSGIGAQYGVEVQYLLWNNPEVGADPDVLVPGENLLVPGTPGIVYDVKLGDTVTDIAATYSIDPAEIVAFAPNQLESADVIVEGSTLVLPGAVPPAPPPEPPVEEPAPVTTPEPEAPAPLEPPPPAQPAPQPPVAVAAPLPTPEPPRPAIASSGYIWPVSGTLNSRFGTRWGSFHSGIDIGAPWGTGVAAAGSGQVVLASYSNYGYGNYVIVRHADGSRTLYAHLSEVYVSLGQHVGQGETVGAVGCSGWCTGPHLHFEVQIGGVAVEPLKYLP